MTTRNVSLPDTLDGFVEQQVASGAFPDASEVVSAGLRLLQHRTDRKAARLERLRAAIQVGLDDLERGDFVEVTDLDAYFRDLEAKVEAELARQRYARLLKAAYRDLQADPERYPSKRPLKVLDVRTYAIRHSKGQVPPTERVDHPRHVIVYSHDAMTVRILRVLHDRMDLKRHVSDL